jgi:hypothetical protein
MSDIGNMNNYVDLLTAQKQLRVSYGYDAPSYATLRRWADSKKLISAERKAEEGGRRVLYSASELERIFLNSKRAKRLALDDQRQSPETGASAGEHTEPPRSQNNCETIPFFEVNSRMDLILDSVAALLARVDELDLTTKACLVSTNRLDSVRTLLMNKYDAAATAQAGLIETLRGQVKQQNGAGDFQQIAHKLGIQLSHLNDKIAALQDDVALMQRPTH